MSKSKRKPAAKKIRTSPEPKTKGGHKRKTPCKIPKAPIRRLLKREGAEKVSDEAVDEMIHQMEESAKTAVKLAKHAKRKTIKARDIPTSDGVQ